MIFLTRMDKQHFFINPDHIVSIEETPDTVITLSNDHHFIVQDSAQVIINKIIAYRARIIRRAGNSLGKKYLAKSHRKLFKSNILNNCTKQLVPGSNARTPHFTDWSSR